MKLSGVWADRLRMLLFVGIVAPAAMVAAGFGLAYLLRGESLDLLRWPAPRILGAGFFTALLTMGLISGLSKIDKRLEQALSDTGTRAGLDALQRAGYPVMLFLVVTSGLGEEALFRGGLQPTVGVVLAALLFGFSHGGWRKEMLPYVLVAAVSGGIFGLLYKLTGDLWAPVTAHAVHNVLSTVLMGKNFEVTWKGRIPIIRLVPEPLDEPSSAEPVTEGTTMCTWESPYAPRPTARELGLALGTLPPGPGNCITDVAGVRVGHATVVSGAGPLEPGTGPVRTGVTAIIPHEGNLFARKVPAGVFVLNGFGKATGLAQVQELGTIETPILLTNTLSTFRVADALVTYMLEQNPDIGVHTGTVNPLVGECNDGYLNDIQGRHVTAEHVRHAIATAQAGSVPQGAVGAGTGMVCCGFKGGVGSASRQAGAYLVGALVLANFGRRSSLMIAGVPVGQRLAEDPGEEGPDPDDVPSGSVMVVLATDAPLDARQLARVAKRGALGLARTGASASNGSGDFVLAFATQNLVEHDPEAPTATVTLLQDGSAALDELFLGAVEAVEEAVVNALFTARTVDGRDGHVIAELPVERVLGWTRRE